VLATAFGLPGLKLKPGAGTPTGPALSQARKLLGEQAMKRIFELDASVADADLGIGLRWKGLEITAIDGTTMELARNNVLEGEFGVPAERARPVLRVTAHVRTATFRWTGAAIGGYHDGENTLADQLEDSFGPGMLNLADRGFFSMHRWIRFSGTGADLAWRIKNSAKSVPLKTQEARALLLSCNITATAAARAAGTAGIDPGLIPFTAVLGLIRSHVAADARCRHCGHRPDDPLASLNAAILALPRHRPGRQRTSGRNTAERRIRHTEEITYTIEITKSNLPKWDTNSGNLRAVGPGLGEDVPGCHPRPRRRLQRLQFLLVVHRAEMLNAREPGREAAQPGPPSPPTRSSRYEPTPPTNSPAPPQCPIRLLSKTREPAGQRDASRTNPQS
jgi:hypothetical protein